MPFTVSNLLSRNPIVNIQLTSYYRYNSPKVQYSKIFSVNTFCLLRAKSMQKYKIR